MTRRQWMWLWIWLLLFFIMFCIWNRLQTEKMEHKSGIAAPVIITDQHEKQQSETSSPVAEKDISLKIVKNGPVVRVSGVFPSEKRLESVIGSLRSAGESVEKGAIIIDPKADNAKIFAALPAMARELAHFDRGVIEYHEKEISVDAITDNPSDKEAMHALLAAIDPSYTVQDQIILEAPQSDGKSKPAPQQTAASKAPSSQNAASAAAQVSRPQQPQPAQKAAQSEPSEQKAQQPKSLKEQRARLQKELDRALRGKRVEFLYAKNVLTAKSRSVLDQVVAILRKYPDMKIEIGGHTDSDGTRARNLKLSQRRAEAVKAYLVKKGIAPERLVARGYGESRPLVKNDTPAHKQRNRRVEFHVIQ